MLRDYDIWYEVVLTYVAAITMSMPPILRFRCRQRQRRRWRRQRRCFYAAAIMFCC